MIKDLIVKVACSSARTGPGATLPNVTDVVMRRQSQSRRDLFFMRDLVSLNAIQDTRTFSAIIPRDKPNG